MLIVEDTNYAMCRTMHGSVNRLQAKLVKEYLVSPCQWPPHWALPMIKQKGECYRNSR
jgi:hypothetical protein